MNVYLMIDIPWWLGIDCDVSANVHYEFRENMVLYDLSILLKHYLSAYL